MKNGNGERIFINEVATRDGFQMEPGFIPTEDKVALIDRLHVAPARVMTILKANAYGHGLVPVARKLE